MRHVLSLRLKLMYSGWAVKVLGALVAVAVTLLLYGLFTNAGDASKLKIGIADEHNQSLSVEIIRSLSENEILTVIPMTRKEGIKAVRENRIEALFILPEDLDKRIEEEAIEGMVEVFFLDENYLPYVLTEIVGSELISPVALTTAFTFYEGALEEAGIDGQEGITWTEFYEQGRLDEQEEVDHFFVKKTYVNDANIQVSDVALDNELMVRQILFGVVHIFITFYMMFLAVNLVRDRQTGVGKRWRIAGITPWKVILGEVFSLVIGGLPILLAVTAVEVMLDGHFLFYLSVNLLFAVAYGPLLYTFSYLFRQVTVFVLVGTALVMILGIISGSFFALNTTETSTMLLSWLTPVYHQLKALTGFVIEGRQLPALDFTLYMLIYGLTCTLLAAWIRWSQIRFFPDRG